MDVNGDVLGCFLSLPLYPEVTCMPMSVSAHRFKGPMKKSIFIHPWDAP